MSHRKRLRLRQRIRHRLRYRPLGSRGPLLRLRRWRSSRLQPQPFRRPSEAVITEVMKVKLRAKFITVEEVHVQGHAVVPQMRVVRLVYLSLCQKFGQDITTQRSRESSIISSLAGTNRRRKRLEIQHGVSHITFASKTSFEIWCEHWVGMPGRPPIPRVKPSARRPQPEHARPARADMVLTSRRSRTPLRRRNPGRGGKWVWVPKQD